MAICFTIRNALTALWNSTLIAGITTLLATAIGTMAAIAAVRYRFRGRQAFQLLAGAPLAFPQLLLGIVLLLWFSVLGRAFNFNTGHRHRHHWPHRIHHAIRNW